MVSLWACLATDRPPPSPHTAHVEVAVVGHHRRRAAVVELATGRRTAAAQASGRRRRRRLRPPRPRPYRGPRSSASSRPCSSSAGHRCALRRLAVVQAGSDALGVAGRGDEPSNSAGPARRGLGAAAEAEEVAIYVGAAVQATQLPRHCRTAAVLVGAG